MSTNTFDHHKRGHDTRNSKQDALSEREFEQLAVGAQRMDGTRGLEAEFVVFLAGKCGLRASEIAHCRESWFDWRRQLIEIPAHQPCTKGRDGGLCGHCRQQVKQAVEYNDIADRETIAKNWWRPKTEAGVRGVPWEHSPRADMIFERFFDEFDRFPKSYNAVGRRVKTAAEKADGIDPADVYPHALRATAATMLVAKGLGTHALTNMFGWANLSTAEVYISDSDMNTRRAVRAAHSQ
jgi:integrase